jgi:hypothetical protein
VKTIVRIRPIRLERETATREDTAERMPATKKMDPRLPSRRSNLTRKKYVTQELDHMCEQ